MLAEVKCCCLAWLGLLHPHLFLDTNGGLAMLREKDNTKVAGTDPSHCKLISSEFSDVFKKPATPLERAIKYEIDFLQDSIAHAKI